ncbi:MAG: flavodoxin family protein [Candidatus Helarchaeota archaeon]
MKIVMAYHTQTGNTKKIAETMKDALEEEDVTISSISEVDPSSLKSYDLAFLGTGIYGGLPGKTLKKLLRDASEIPPKIVLFYTHATADPKIYKKFLKRIRKRINEAGSMILDEFECLGDDPRLTLDEKLERVKDLPPDKQKAAEEAVENLIGHPNTEDLENARYFVKSIIKRIKTGKL